MFLGKIHSPANPIQGSPFSTYGYKPSENAIVFSVGDISGGAPGTGTAYVTRTPSGNLPSITIDNGVLTFSYPQTHQYVGVGDKVWWGAGSLSSELNCVYLTKKISTRKWQVKTSTGGVPDDLAETVIVNINKRFSSLRTAIGTSSSGARNILGEDLTALNICLFIACYEQTSDTSSPMEIVNGWTTSKENYIKVFAPNDVSIECNKSQRHGHSWGGYSIQSNSAAALITVSADYVIIDGLCVGDNSLGTNGIIMSDTGIISNCIVDGFSSYGIRVNTTDEVIVASNIVYGSSGVGMGANAATKLLNNTVNGYTTGYEFTAAGANTVAVNCIAANCTTDFSGHLASTLYYCADEDGSAAGTTSPVTTTFKFYDASGGDFRLTNANSADIIQQGTDPSSYSYYAINKDASGNLVDNTWSRGALHLVLSVPYAIGANVDIKTGSNNFTISNGIITFNDAQVNNLLTAGCVVNGTITLTEKINNSNWRCCDASTGLASGNTGSTPISNIKPPYISVTALLSALGSYNLVTTDIKLRILYNEQASPENISITSLTSDATRTVEILSPYNTGTECNSRLRHSGVWNSSLAHIISITSETLYMTVSGIQISDASGIGVELSGVGSRIESCIVKNCNTGIKIHPSENDFIGAVINNIVYDCDGMGIYAANDGGYGESKFAIYNNTVYNCGYGIQYDSASAFNGNVKNTIRLINNLLILNTIDLHGDAGKSDSISSESNWTSDDSAFSLFLDFNNDIYKSIRFLSKNNFHIPLAEHILMTSSYRACADHFFQVYSDIDSIDRPTNGLWSIGADQYSIPTKKIAYFSVGLNPANLQGSSGMAVSVSGSIAEFASSLLSPIGIGDKVTTAAGVMYLAEKGDANTWRVVDNNGAAVSDIAGTTLTSITRVSNSLASAMGGDVSTALNIGGKNIASNLIEVRVECYQDTSAADTSKVIILGWNTTSDYCITIESPYDTFTQCGSRQRHSGIWSVNYYHMEMALDAITITNKYIHIDGLQVDSQANTAIRFYNNSDESSVKRCVIKGASVGINQDVSSYNIRIASNIIYGLSSYGIAIKGGTANNNTVVGNTSTLFNVGATVTLTNNIAQGSAVNYAGTALISSCISSDLTGDITGVSLDFVNSSSNDYHIARDDFEALNYGEGNAYNPTRDIDSEEIIEHSIGADCRDDDTIHQTFSCGKFSSNLVNLVGLTISVNGNIAVFSNAIEDYKVMIGDKIIYDVDSKVAFLYKKISTFSWEVVDRMGDAPGNASAAQITSFKHTFNYIENVFNNTASDSLAQFYGDATNKFLSLSKGKMKISIALSGESSNISPVSISGFETDEPNYLRIYAPYQSYECNVSHKHTGTFNPSDITTVQARILYTGPIGSYASLMTTCPYTEIDGLIVQGIKANHPSGASNIDVKGTTNCKVINNILLDSAFGVEAYSASDSLHIIVNNIIYGFELSGIITSTKDYIYNNTIVKTGSAGLYGIQGAVGCVVRNNIAQLATAACYLNCTTDHCLSSDASASNPDDTPSTTLTFSGSNNYNLAKTDAARGKGVQLTGDIIYPFNTDAAGNIRGRFWDMGALEYQATNKAYYSVGNASDHKTGSGITITVDDDSIGTFSEPQTSELLVSGDKVLCEGAITLYLAEKINDSDWYVTLPDGTSSPIGTLTVTSITRAFTTITEAISNLPISYFSGKNLVNLELQVNIVKANDSLAATSSQCNISSFTCDCDYFIKIFTPTDAAKYCNQSQKHKGQYNEGAQSNFNSSIALNISNTDYFEISGLIINNSSLFGKAIVVNTCGWFLINSNIIRWCHGGAISITQNGSSSLKRTDIIVNNIINNCPNGGIIIEGNYIDYVWIMNNTIYNCDKGIHFKKSISGLLVVYAYNNICQKNAFADFVEDHISNTGKFLLFYNVSEDESAGGSGYNFNTLIEFKNAAGEQFFPEPEEVCINSALDIRDISPYYFFEDCRGVDRANYLWDRGAIERNEITGSGVMSIGPIYIQNQFGIATFDYPTLILYLRTIPREGYPLYLQFDHIEGSGGINEYLAGNNIDNIIIYVESDIDQSVSFQGTFELNDRDTRTVFIAVDPLEAKNGPAHIIYPSTGLIDNASNQSNLTFQNIIISSTDTTYSPYLISGSASTSKMVFINCIVQLNLNAFTSAACIIDLINSIALFRNTSDESIIYLVDNSITGHQNYNSILIIDGDVDKTFRTCSGAADDYINNAITWNVNEDYLFSIDAPGRKLLCLENTNPLLAELEADWNSLEPSDIMDSKFNPTIESPVADNGNSIVLDNYSIPYDIQGNDRTYRFSDIDIGPYELEIHIMDIFSSDIQSIDQVKINIDRVNKSLISYDNNVLYQDLYNIFQYNQDTMEEFIRDDKVVIKLKTTTKGYELKSDKAMPLIGEFEAYYDNASDTIIVSKIDGESNNLLGGMLEDDTYFLHFNEQEHKLYLYLNEAVTMGISGSKNPIKNVKFGGNPTF